MTRSLGIGRGGARTGSGRKSGQPRFVPDDSDRRAFADAAVSRGRVDELLASASHGSLAAIVELAKIFRAADAVARVAGRGAELSFGSPPISQARGDA